MTKDQRLKFPSRRVGCPKGAAIRPAQGNALGNVSGIRLDRTAQRANRSSGERLARWADGQVGFSLFPRALPWAGRTSGPLAQRSS